MLRGTEKVAHWCSDTDVGVRDTWSEAELAVRAAATAEGRRSLKNNAQEIGCDAMSECATKVARELSMA